MIDPRLVEPLALAFGVSLLCAMSGCAPVYGSRAVYVESTYTVQPIYARPPVPVFVPLYAPRPLIPFAFYAPRPVFMPPPFVPAPVYNFRRTF